MCCILLHINLPSCGAADGATSLSIAYHFINLPPYGTDVGTPTSSTTCNTTIPMILHQRLYLDVASFSSTTGNSSLFIFLHVVLQNLMQAPNTNWWILLHSVPHMVLLLEVPHTKPIFQSSLLWWCIWCSKELQEPLTVLTNFPSLIQAIHSLKSVYQSARIGEFCSCYCGTPMP